MVLPTALVLAQALAPSSAWASAPARAWAADRPPECDRPARGNVWERAKSPELGRYCDLIASASSKLAAPTGEGRAARADEAKAALDDARGAEELLHGHAAPRVLEGRALARLGRFDEAYRAFADARARDPRAFDIPITLRAWARVLARTGHAADAVEAYRALLPRVSALAPSDRASAAVEAGLVAMEGGPALLDEAVAALRDAMRVGGQKTREVAALALALALDRRGDAEEARALLAERSPGDPRDVVGSPEVVDLLAVAPAEASALVALALERTDRAGARDAWRAYLRAAPGGVWAARARARLAKPLGARDLPPSRTP